MEKIKLLHNSALDLEQWDNSVYQAVNSREYAMSWFLDAVWPDWHGLVYNDYMYVMPVAMNKKWGFRYAFQPPYSQQHGIFPTATPEIMKQMLDMLSNSIDYFHLALNSMNTTPTNSLTIQKRTNLILSLNPDYDEIRKNYSTHCIRNLKKSSKANQIDTNVSLHDFFRLKNRMKNNFESKADIQTLSRIVTHALTAGKGVIYGAYNKYNELVSAAFFLREKNRWTYLNACSDVSGFETASMYAVIDTFIANHAKTILLLDFEGSMLEGLARFYRGFGATEEYYNHLHYNNLPSFIRIFKK